MIAARATPWILFKETGELACKRCGKTAFPASSNYAEIRIEGERFQLAHKSCKPKPVVKP